MHPRQALILLLGLLVCVISAVLAAPTESTTAEKCPPKNVTHLLSNGKRYYFHKKWIEFEAAQALCKRNNMFLAIVDNRADLDVVHAKALTIAGNAWWVDASDDGHGNFKWGNGKELARNDSLWWEDQPNKFGQGKKACVVFSTFYTKQLWDEHCRDDNFAVCQVPDGVTC